MEPRFTVISGCMYAGKTSELLRRVERAKLAGQSVHVVVSQVDTRHGLGVVQSHDACRLTGVPVTVASTPEFLRDITADAMFVAVDEAQFFAGLDLPRAVVELLRRGVSVVAAGLDLDYRGQPFGPMPQLLAMAHEVVELRAVCTRCGGEASRTLRTSKVQGTVLVGAAQEYEAACLVCWSAALRAEAYGSGTGR